MGVYDGTSEYEVGLLIDDIKVLMAEYNLAKKINDEEAESIIYIVYFDFCDLIILSIICSSSRL